jgi:hypothetical protein
MIIEFLSFALNLFFWYFVVSFIVHLLLRRSEREEKKLIEMVERIHEVIHRVRVEEHYNNYYWYDANSDKFLAQGSTPDELIDRLKARFPTHIFLLEDKDTVIKLSGPDWKMTRLPESELG